MSHPVIVRPACLADSDQVLAWRNEPLTVTMSPTGAVSPEDHARWYPGAITNPNRLLLIGALLAEPATGIGVCRFDLAEDGQSAEASINLVAAFHGRGLGAPLLAAGIARFEQDFPAIPRLTARIKPANIASRKCFAVCGFTPDPDAPLDDIGHYIRHRTS